MDLTAGVANVALNEIETVWFRGSDEQSLLWEVTEDQSDHQTLYPSTTLSLSELKTPLPN